jgi:hypothetical protein
MVSPDGVRVSKAYYILKKINPFMPPVKSTLPTMNYTNERFLMKYALSLLDSWKADLGDDFFMKMGRENEEKREIGIEMALVMLNQALTTAVNDVAEEQGVEIQTKGIVQHVPIGTLFKHPEARAEDMIISFETLPEESREKALSLMMDYFNSPDNEGNKEEQKRFLRKVGDLDSELGTFTTVWRDENSDIDDIKAAFNKLNREQKEEVAGNLRGLPPAAKLNDEQKDFLQILHLEMGDDDSSSSDSGDTTDASDSDDELPPFEPPPKDPDGETEKKLEEEIFRRMNKLAGLIK